jgi:pyruvate formate lyase activating enzyme
VLAPGETGECRVRANVDGEVVALTYGQPCALNVDPVEKKPLFHFLPGTDILSVGTEGCNLRCRHCQNWSISQAGPPQGQREHVRPEDIPPLANRYGCPAVAYTYTEPLVSYEYVLDCSEKVQEEGLKNAIVSAGYVNEEPFRRLAQHVHGANIDLKAMTDDFYKKVCGARLQPVLDTLALAKELGMWVEVTNLIIPEMNDSAEEVRSLAQWVAENMGRETPVHFSAFHPQHKMRDLPATPAATLTKATDIAKEEGLHYVYVGNAHVEGGLDTACPGCGETVIRRGGYVIRENRLRDGACPDCGAEVHGVWF